MKDGHDLNLVSRNCEEDGKRKSPNYASSESSIDDWVLLRIRDYPRQGVVDTLHKLKV
jgi:hypothetical protein